MAYGVKYRLDFADIQGNPRRLDILQNNYTGSILPMIGGASPVVIKWEIDNDFYDPIVASNCEISLLQTDDVEYLDFYDFDEREFLVKVYDYSGSAYTLYWQGYLIQDTYTQKITSAPFEVSFKAIDGLSTLKGIDFPLAPEQTVTLWQCIYEIIQETGLEYSLFVRTDLKEVNRSTFTNVFTDVKIDTSTYSDDNTYKFDSLKVLKSILGGFNCRIFQADGNYFIANNADLTLSSPIAYRQYLSNGTFVIATNAGTTYTVPFQMLPMGQDLAKETSGAVLDVALDVDLTKQLNYIPNGNFENDLTSWTYNATYTSIDTNTITGYKSAKVTGTSSSFTSVLSNTWDATAWPYQDKKTAFSLKFEIQMQNAGFQATLAEYSVPWRLSFRVQQYSGSTPTGTFATYYYGDIDSLWGSAIVNTFVYSGRGEWSTFNKTIDFDFNIISGYKPHDFTIEFGRPNLLSGLAHGAMFISGVQWNWDKIYYAQTPTTTPIFINFTDKNLTVQRRQTTSKKITNKLEYKDLYQGSTYNPFLKGYLQPESSTYYGYVVKFVTSLNSNGRFIEDIVAQQRLNDCRLKIERYEGVFKRVNSPIAVRMYDKLQIDFNTFTEAKLLILDSIEYNVKQNTYNTLTHLGDQTTDVASLFSSNQLSYPVDIELVCAEYQVSNYSQTPGNSLTVSYLDCSGTPQELVVPYDSQSPAFCASTTPEWVAGSNQYLIEQTGETCTP